MNGQDSAPAHAALDALLSRPAGEVFDALARRVLGKPGDLATLLAPVLGDAKPKYATAKHNPLGSERGFKNAARHGGFKVFKRGREVAALWTDVEAYVESRRIEKAQPAPKAPSEEDLARAELAAAGVRFRAKGARK